jgi:hypothetical protein
VGKVEGKSEVGFGGGKLSDQFGEPEERGEGLLPLLAVDCWERYQILGMGTPVVDLGSEKRH